MTIVEPKSSPDTPLALKKPDVVLIHGTGSGASMWKPQAELLSNLGYRCFLPDLRGHGKTPEPNESAGLEEHMADLVETLEQTDIEYPAIFIGHSLGAVISMNLATKRRDLFKEIYAVAMPAKIFTPLAMFAKFILTAPYEKLRGTAFYKSLSWRPKLLIDTERFTFFEILEICKSLDYVADPLTTNCQVHLAAGRFDPVALSYYIAKMHKKLPNSTFRMFEMAGHNFMDMYPEKFNQWLLNYIEPQIRT